MSECIFCSDSLIKERKIIGDEFAWAFPTNIPIVPGHLLISPVKHKAFFEELTQEELTSIFSILEKVKKALVEVFNAEGFNYAWNEGKAAGQSVQHFHLHVVPRKSGDTGIYEYDPRKFLYRPGSREETSEAELNSIAKLIKDRI